MNTKEIKAWHFLKDDGRTGEGDLLVIPGEIMRVEPPVILCHHGFHASIRAIDALKYAPGAMVQRVVLRGEIVQDDDKLVASERECLWVFDETQTLHEFAIWCAERALNRVDNPDPRSLKALEIKRQWLNGQATDDELDAAWDAAWVTARVPAWVAARGAPWDAAWVAARDHQNQHLETMLEQYTQSGATHAT